MMINCVDVLPTGKPRYTPVDVPDVLFGEMFLFTCDCGWHRTIHRLPVRCRDCGEWWLDSGQISRTPGATLQKF